jgi:hypothetical protein
MGSKNTWQFVLRWSVHIIFRTKLIIKKLAVKKLTSYMCIHKKEYGTAVSFEDRRKMRCLILSKSNDAYDHDIFTINLQFELKKHCIFYIYLQPRGRKNDLQNVRKGGQDLTSHDESKHRSPTSQTSPKVHTWFFFLSFAMVYTINLSHSFVSI